LAEKVLRLCLESVVVADGEFQGLAGELLPGQVHEDERLVPLWFSRALHVARATLVAVRTAHATNQ